MLQYVHTVVVSARGNHKVRNPLPSVTILSTMPARCHHPDETLHKLCFVDGDFICVCCERLCTEITRWPAISDDDLEFPAPPRDVAVVQGSLSLLWVSAEGVGCSRPRVAM